jgi:DNA-binding CsgD family transcriptional regulator
MYLSDDKLGLMQEHEALVLEVAPSVCQLTDAQYFTFVISSPNKRSGPLLITNDPPEHIPIYLSVSREDFLMDSIISNHKECVLHRLPQYRQPPRLNQHFINAVQSVRPISDIVYIPITMSDMFIGAWSAARAGLDGPQYTNGQLEVFRFVVAFLNDAFARSLLPPPLEEDTAYLDYHGHVVQVGAIIKNAFDMIFGRGLIREAKPCHDDLRKLFRDGYQRFLHGPFKIGMDRLTLHSRNRNYSFLFKLLRPHGLPLHVDGIPFASVILLDETVEQGSAQVLDWPGLSQIYSFTRRESQVILGIFKGQTNKEIAFNLGVDESTVKRHTHNIYEKSGFSSRVELVLGLNSAHKIN